VGCLFDPRVRVGVGALAWVVKVALSAVELREALSGGRAARS
jgi:hypothetical protein